MAERSLTAFVWWIGMCVCFCSGDLSVCHVAVDCSLLHCLLKFNIPQKMKVRTVIPNHLQFLLDSQGFIWFAFSFTPRHHWPISIILPVNKDLGDFGTSSRLRLAFFCQSWKGTENRKDPSQSSSARHREDSGLMAACHTHPGTEWGEEEEGDQCGRWQD